MKCIDLKDLNLRELKKYPSIGMNSRIYIYGDNLVKIYNDLSEKCRRIMEKKIILLEDISVDFLIMPHTLIYDKGVLVGSIMQNCIATSLEDFVRPNSKLNVSEYLKIMKELSLKIKVLHEKGVIFQDLSGGNILIDKNLNIRFCDIESCIYKDYDSPYISNLFRRYTYFHPSIKEKNDNADRITLFLSFYYYLFTREIQRTSFKQYDALSQKIDTLKDMREIAIMLKTKSSNINSLPYLEDFIVEEPDTSKYIITPKFSLF